MKDYIAGKKRGRRDSEDYPFVMLLNVNRIKFVI
jgi:hypothetical protein